MAKGRPGWERSPESQERKLAQVRASNRARYRATQMLIDRYPHEFAALYQHFAEQAGVEPMGRRAGHDEAEMRAELALLQTQLAELQQLAVG